MRPIRTFLATALFALSVLFFISPDAQAQCLLTNGDFETGTLTGWTTYTRTTTGGNWFNYTGTVTPAALKPISAPPQGSRGAVADQLGPITEAIYQDFTLPAGQSGTLSFYVYYNNTHTTFLDFNSLDYLIGSQLYRIDLIKTSAANLETVSPSDVYLNLFRTKAGDPLVLAPTLMTLDISGFAGLTSRLRFAASVDQNYFPAGFDNVCISTTRGTLSRSTPLGSNVISNFGGVTVRFPSVTAAGTTSLQQLDPAVAQVGPPLNNTFMGPAYNISTTATVTTPMTVCMYLPSITNDTIFGNIKLLQKVAGIWVEIPSSRRNIAARQLCGDVVSLGEFTVGHNPVVPTAAPAEISGTVTTPDGQPLGGVTVNLSGTASRKTITDSAGNYHFEDVETNEFYTVAPSMVNYEFSPAQRSFSLLGNKSDAVFTATREAISNGAAIDTADYFVRQHYLDFLGREPDESGFNFWSGQIIECGRDLGCAERRRINVSAAYFLSIEFQQTGGLVDGLYRASYGRRALFAEFMPDAAVVGRDVVVGRGDWARQLDLNTQAFIDGWVQRPAFRAAYDGLANDRYIDELVTHTGVNFTSAERAVLVDGLTSGALTRAGALRRIVEDGRFVAAKRNEVFVMMEYFGYLRRDPDAAGYRFWLDKLNQFDGNFEQAEMVKAFIVSGEYRARFPQ